MQNPAVYSKGEPRAGPIIRFRKVSTYRVSKSKAQDIGNAYLNDPCYQQFAQCNINMSDIPSALTISPTASPTQYFLHTLSVKKKKNLWLFTRQAFFFF